MIPGICRTCLKRTFIPQLLVTAVPTVRYKSSAPIDFPDMGPPIPEYQPKTEESDNILKARLLYQCRKRGISENGLILGNFASKYLNTFNRLQLEEFDYLINKPSNDWDIFYWVMEKVETPKEYDTSIMNMLKEYTKNTEMEARYRQPDLDFKDEVNK